MMQYVALASAEESIQRVRERAERGGHSAPPKRIREIYEASLQNLARALKEFDYVGVFDNTDITRRKGPKLVLETVEGHMVSLARQVPEWTMKALRGTAYEITPRVQKTMQTEPGH